MDEPTCTVSLSAARWLRAALITQLSLALDANTTGARRTCGARLVWCCRFWMLLIADPRFRSVGNSKTRHCRWMSSTSLTLPDDGAGSACTRGKVVNGAAPRASPSRTPPAAR